MAISDKSRKVLWGRSGNRCAVCRREMVVDATSNDNESVIGEECHIVSGRVGGPRYDPQFPAERVDDLSNLVLLCRVHHKMVDDQVETYTTDLLTALKLNHEKWVSVSLADDKPTPPVRVRRIKENMPNHLVRLTSGRDLLAIIEHSMAFDFDHDEPQSQDEAELLSGFLQEAQDLGDIDLEAGDRVKASFSLTSSLQDLEQAGFVVFGGREMRRLEGGIGPPSSFPISILRVLRSTNPKIIRWGVPPDSTGRTEGSA